jgi:hypothetical protein
MLKLSLLHDVLRYLHIGAGFFGLAAFWIPALAKKGSPLHVACGKFFALCAWVVGVSALVSGFWGVVDPVGFLTRQGVPEVAAQRNAGNVRFLFFILLYLATAILSGVSLGVRVLQTKNDPAKLNTALLRWILHLGGAAAAALTLFGVAGTFTSDSDGRYVICIVVGVLGMTDWRENSMFLRNPRPTPRAWWYKHMECMIGCGIGFHTAFLVFGLSRLVPSAVLPGAWALLPWILPTAIGIPIMLIWIRYYKRRFGELNSQPKKPVPA